MAADCKSAGVMPTVVQIHPGPQFIAGVAQLVEHQPSKLRVAGSSLVSRSMNLACIAQLVEHFHGKEGVISSNLIVGSCRFWFFLKCNYLINKERLEDV